MPLERLLREGELDPDALSACMDRAEAENVPLEQALFEAGHIGEQQFLAICGERYGMPFAPDLGASVWNGESRWRIDADLMRRFSFAWLKKRQAIPLRDADGNMVIAAARPSGWLHAQEFGVLTGERPRFRLLAPEAAIGGIINRVQAVVAQADGAAGAPTLHGLEIVHGVHDGVVQLLYTVI